MIGGWTFGRRIAAGFAAIVGLAVVVSVISVVTLETVVTSKDRVINVNSRQLTDAQALRAAAGDKSSAARGFLLTGDSRYLTQMTDARHAFRSQLSALSNIVDPADRGLVSTIGADESAHQAAINSAIARRDAGASLALAGRLFATHVDPLFNKLESDLIRFTTSEQARLASARQSSTNTADDAVAVIVGISILAVLLSVLLAIVLTRRLRGQIGSALGEVRNSSTELQATANQQATGAKEQATAMNEITTTISELVATSRQIAESAQRVAQVAEQTAGAGRSGTDTIGKAKESIEDIRRQVDVIVDHMLELGDKSQQIGAVVDIVTELAEQTNILAINSTIEAAGAGEAGKRFAVVADEIRKLADRVAGSTKEIRALIDVVRGAVNTTVMATEIGSKAVDAGNDQFSAAASAFGEISELATTTTEAAQEIELSTKQQTTAVEQVNVAISYAAQTTIEAEASATQTLQTASQLANLAADLATLVERQAA
jgi:methyl-accepting chemotaxis protein